ncbi:MAG: DNA polymerase IV [Bacteroidales bacterium]|nr:DNA polymerase IV [Bacteroidales bacterium]
MRKIIHLDMDAFYASVEQRDDKSLRGKPVAVGHDAPRSVVATASYEARKFGVHSAMSVQTAKRLCKDLIIVEPHFEKYKEVSQTVHALMREYTDIIEPVSLDEAFMDVTHNKKGEELAVNIAKELKSKIFSETFLTSSAGISYNKFLAKIASDWNKPDGLKIIHPSQAQDFINDLKVEKIWGIGPKTLSKMHDLGIYTGRQLREKTLLDLIHNFGKMGKVFYDYARGIDESEVENSWIRKSVSCERTMESDIKDRTAMIVALYNVVLDLTGRIAKAGFNGKRLTLKVKYYDFTIQTRSITQRQILDTKEKILPLAKQLAKQIPYNEKPVRLVGLGVSDEVVRKDKELSLFD